jgi:hypothetical protein
MKQFSLAQGDETAGHMEVLFYIAGRIRIGLVHYPMSYTVQIEQLRKHRMSLWKLPFKAQVSWLSRQSL